VDAKQFNYIGGGQWLGMGFNSLSFGTPAYGEAARRGWIRPP